MAKLSRTNHKGQIGYMFRCPGCECAHLYIVEGEGAKWKFDGNEERPTFNPSLVTWGKGDKSDLCHLYVKDGRIEFLSDCKHAMAGKTVDMEDWD